MDGEMFRTELPGEYLGSIPRVFLQSRKNSCQGSGTGQIIQSHPFFIKDARNGNISQGPEERRAEFLGLAWLEGNVRSQVWMTRSTMPSECWSPAWDCSGRAQAGLPQPWEPRGAGLGLRVPERVRNSRRFLVAG